MNEPLFDLQAWKQRQLSSEPKAIDLVKSNDGRWWFTDGINAWNYPGGGYAVTPLANLDLEIPTSEE